MQNTREPEFWVMIVTNIVGAVVALLTVQGKLTPEEGDQWVALAAAMALPAAILIMGWVNKSYVEGQTAIKEARLIAGIK